ncbi:MotA/TolQ/ExbB proton channel family protein [Sulfurimonas sp. HSL-3221]|uniref:MotA/TolQ/ExbB proton channel family protein n=1 Tax=Sulfurimonadaceae TaxID=2771471 RepID=UPI001E36DDEE|nr:MotA/TolQ/ExbB proton channel family protein [Sulfurimonas sp. HSL-3221]UFS63323.1 MotA/TolQ/ExbB proton channel family protein [Sulfurimonas sp. HSL-3221]
MFDSLSDYYLKSNSVTLAVLALLALYFIVINWTFFYRYLSLNRWVDKETDSLESLLMGAQGIAANSYLNHFIKSSKRLSAELFDLGLFAGTKEATKGLAILSVVASTAPFIGLFGTVVSILDTFNNIGSASGTMAVIAAGVSDALVATAAGIFVAIFAYTYHQILKRRAYELTGLLQMQRDALMAKETDAA